MSCVKCNPISMLILAFVVVYATVPAAAQVSIDLIDKPYQLETGMESRSISFENPTGAPGEGGKAKGRLGVGRKGRPCRRIKPGEKVQLCDIEGPGAIRHIWMTTKAKPGILRGLVLRAWWDDQKHPCIECPLGDFFGISHGAVTGYQSAVHSVGPKAGMNIWIPMPFNKRARFEITNESGRDAVLFYQIDYTLQGPFPPSTGRLHVCFRRENPTTLKQDFVLLPERHQRGRFIGSLIGIRSEHPYWWGEGEVKAYLDDDTDFPTICGTGSEDYVGLSWGIQEVQYMYNGCALDRKDANGHTFVTMYRWHLPDPIVWRKKARITIQQIAAHKKLLETQDDWSCASFWYEPVPSEPLPAMPDFEARVKNPMVKAKKK